MSDWGKILVGTRLEKQVDSAFVPVWCELITKGLRAGDSWAIERDKISHRALNALVRALLASDCDTLCTIDSDADFAPDTLSELRDYEPGWQYDALQAFYCRRGWPPQAIWITPSGDGRWLHNIVVHPDAHDEVGVIGTHFALFRRQIFEAMLAEHPEIPERDFDWFYYPRHRAETEDSMLSMDAARLGFRLGATTHVKTGHISRVVIGWETYQEWLTINKDQVEKQIQAVRQGLEEGQP